MKLTVLVDNNTLIDRYYTGEPGLSFYIEEEGRKILFDTGYSDILIRNAETMGIGLNGLNTIVLSHGHNDHTRGLLFLRERFDLSRTEIVAHPDAFVQKILDLEEIGSPFSEKEMRQISSLRISRTPLTIGEHFVFLGEIPELLDFEKRLPLGAQIKNGLQQDDFLLDDTALVYKGKDGLFVITGCSHSGICNLIEYAKSVCKDARIAGVIGGFHLFEPSRRLEKTIEYFNKNNIKRLFPCHCVSFAAKAEMHKCIPLCDIGVGTTIET